MNHWIKTFDELSLDELYRIIQLRIAVFCVEQNCPYQDLDGWDSKGLHIGFLKDGNIGGYARILPPDTIYPEPSICRVVIGREFRGKGTGRKVMDVAIRECRKHYPDKVIRIMAQSYLQEFYESLGFIVDGDEFLEDGLPHKEMILPTGS